MKMIKFLPLTIVLVTLMISSCTKKQPDQPNIIFFIADDMYRDMFNCLAEGKGKNLAPNIDRLAREGTIMMNQYVVSPVCTPSRYNCLTGNYASRSTSQQFINQTANQHGQTVVQWNSHISSKEKTLAHYLKELGYTTGLAGKNHVIEVEGLYNFPDYQADPRHPEIKKHLEENYAIVQQSILNAGFDFAEGIYQNNPDWIGLAELAVQNMDWTTEAGVNFIDQVYEDPFFLYFATNIPHHPTEPDRSWKADPRITPKGYIENPPTVLPSRESLTDRIKKAGLKSNDKELVLWLDDALGALIEKLEEHDILDNTIIFFFNDHGQSAKGTLYQGGTLNPSIVWKSGGFKVGSHSNLPVTNLDFTPTILEFAGAQDLSDKFDGNSFKNVLDGKVDHSSKPIFLELGFARAIIKGKYKYLAVRYPEYLNKMTSVERGVILEDYNKRRLFMGRQILNDDPEKPFSHLSAIPGGRGAELESYGKKPGYFDADQLYDLEADPDEMVNLAKNGDFQDVLTDLKMEMSKYLNNLPGKFGELKR